MFVLGGIAGTIVGHPFDTVNGLFYSLLASHFKLNFSLLANGPMPPLVHSLPLASIA